jgi:hypothetical protein
MKEARYVVRLAHARLHQPEHQSELLGRIRELIKPLGGKAINLRISRQALEFDLFCDPKMELHPFFTALDPLGKVLTYRRLDTVSPVGIPANVISEARGLFNEERYWEAHEVLEGLWKSTQGSERQLLQGLILTAAALVHVQKNETGVVGRMLEDAAQRLKNQPATYFGLDMRAFSRAIQKMILTRTYNFPSI